MLAFLSDLVFPRQWMVLVNVIDLGWVEASCNQAPLGELFERIMCQKLRSPHYLRLD